MTTASSAVPDLIGAEEAVVFGRGLVGVVTRPAAGRGDAGVILLNAGVVHRVGPNRLYVTLARRLADRGFTVLRFDHSGIGDSDARDDHLDASQAFVTEAVDAMNWLAAERQCRTFVLVSLCSGTLTAFRAAQADSRVTSLILLTALLLDPTTVPAETVARASDRRIARSYLVDKIRSARGWWRVFTGQLDYRRVWRVARDLLLAPVGQKPEIPGLSEMLAQLQTLLERGVGVHFVYPEPSTVLEGFRMTIAPELSRLRRRGQIDLTVIKHADHTFTRLQHQAQLIELLDSWLARCI